MDFRRTIILDNYVPTADGTETFDLPVSPLSHLCLTICGENLAAEATPAEICSNVPSVRVLHRGSSVINMSAEDLLALNHILLRKEPIIGNQDPAVDDLRSLGLIIPMGRFLYDPDECFPESKAGELQLQLEFDIATTHLDALRLQVEAVELPEAHPRQHLKATTLTATPGALGDFDLDLPVRNRYAGILLYSTTIPDASPRANTINAIKLLADNTERLISAANWECLHADLVQRCGMYPGYIAAQGDDNIAHYSFADFDPRDNSMFLLDTAPLAALKLRIEIGVLDEEIRAIPVEIQTP